MGKNVVKKTRADGVVQGYHVGSAVAPPTASDTAVYSGEQGKASETDPAAEAMQGYAALGEAFTTVVGTNTGSRYPLRRHPQDPGIEVDPMTIDSILDEAGYDGDVVRTSYSGRRMNGAECLGFTVAPGDEDYLTDIIREALGQDVPVESDAMGRGSIVYLPSHTSPGWKSYWAKWSN